MKPPQEIFISAVRRRGDLGGVFECDGRSGYFYLYSLRAPEGKKVLDSILVFSGDSNFEEKDFSVVWDGSDEKVGLLVKGKLSAAFDVLSKEKFGGHSFDNESNAIPSGYNFDV